MMMIIQCIEVGLVELTVGIALTIILEEIKGGSFNLHLMIMIKIMTIMIIVIVLGVDIIMIQIKNLN